jgi:hypothetical protein
LRVRRFAHLKEATIGALDVDGAFECFTLEDQWQRVKIPGETRIPAGVYKLRLRTGGSLHKKFKARYPEHRGMLELVDVPGFTAILLHPGNTEAQSAGCLLVGDGAIVAGELTNSVQAYRRLYTKVVQRMLAGEEVAIEVVDL